MASRINDYDLHLFLKTRDIIYSLLDWEPMILNKIEKKWGPTSGVGCLSRVRGVLWGRWWLGARVHGRLLPKHDRQDLDHPQQVWVRLDNIQRNCCMTHTFKIQGKKHDMFCKSKLKHVKRRRKHIENTMPDDKVPKKYIQLKKYVLFFCPVRLETKGLKKQ